MARRPSELDVRQLARAHTKSMVNVLLSIARRGKNEAARVTAATFLIDRGWGKAPQAITGAGGEGDIRITIRTILEGVAREEPPHLIVDHSEAGS